MSKVDLSVIGKNEPIGVEFTRKDVVLHALSVDAAAA